MGASSGGGFGIFEEELAATEVPFNMDDIVLVLDDIRCQINKLESEDRIEWKMTDAAIMQMILVKAGNLIDDYWNRKQSQPKTWAPGVDSSTYEHTGMPPLEVRFQDPGSIGDENGKLEIG